MRICFQSQVTLPADDVTTAETTVSTDAPGTSQEQEVQEPPPKKQRTLGSWLGRKSSANDPVQTQPRIRLSQEIDLYMALPCIDCEENPLSWWKKHMKDFKMLAPLARKYLAIQATSSPSERLFSKAGHIITLKRAQLNPEKANMLVFLAQNL